MARGHAASEHGSDLLLEARRAENESAIGCRADLVDNGLVQRLAEQGPIGFAARVRATAEPHVLVVRFDQMARLAFGVDPVTRPPVSPGMARHAGAVGIELETICNLAKPTFCRSMNDTRNMIVSSGIKRQISRLTRRSSSMMSCCRAVLRLPGAGLDSSSPVR
jgi:hypothetical protein